MSETETLPPLTSPIRWTPREREVWLDLFSTYSELLITNALEEASGLARYDEEALATAVKLAAELADTAMMEIQYRDHKHPNQPKRRTNPNALRRPRR